MSPRPHSPGLQPMGEVYQTSEWQNCHWLLFTVSANDDNSSYRMIKYIDVDVNDEESKFFQTSVIEIKVNT